MQIVIVDRLISQEETPLSDSIISKRS